MFEHYSERATVWSINSSRLAADVLTTPWEPTRSYRGLRARPTHRRGGKGSRTILQKVMTGSTPRFPTAAAVSNGSAGRAFSATTARCACEELMDPTPMRPAPKQHRVN